MRTRSLSLAVVVAAVATTSVGCNDNNNTPTVSVGTTQVVALDTVTEVQWEGGILWGIANTFDPISAAGALIDPGAALDAVVANVNTGIGPRGCANTSRGTGMVTVRFNNCNPPFGVANSTAALGVSFAQNGDAIEINASSSTVKATMASLTLNATALYTATGSSRVLTVNSSSHGTGPLGVPTARTGQYVLTWTAGQNCVTFDGAVSTQPGSLDRTSFSAYTICTTGCPLSGSTTHTDPNSGVTVTTIYNGTNTVSFTGSDGSTGTSTISCQ